MARAPVFPARFATLFSSPESLERMLGIHYETVVRFLDYMRGKEEWAVKGFLDRAKAEDDLFVSQCQRSALSRSPGVRYLQEQRLRAGVGKEVSTWLNAVAADIKKEVQNKAVGTCEKRLQHREVSGRESDMAFNWAVLLRKEELEQFRGWVEQTNSKFLGKGLTIEMTGPWPPYSFRPSLADDESGERTRP
jgi:hypothetical protein